MGNEIKDYAQEQWDKYINTIEKLIGRKLDDSISYMGMCEIIEKAQKLMKPDFKKTAEEIYNSHPSGELFWIPEEYLRSLIVVYLVENKGERNGK